MNKRIKSGLMTYIPVIAAIITTPAWADFVKFTNDKLSQAGVNIAISALIGVVLSEVWKHFVNQYTLKQLQSDNQVAAVQAHPAADLY